LKNGNAFFKAAEYYLKY